MLRTVLILLALAVAAPAAPPAAAQVGTRAYAPEDLRTLSRRDQIRVISQEYSEQSRGARIPDDQLRFYLDQVNRSNWSFSRIRQDIARSLARNGDGDGNRPPATGVLRCESTDNRPRDCPTPWQGRSRLVRQLSGSACIEGRTWHSQRGQVSVSGGCRGEFSHAAAIAPPVAGLGVIRCESIDNRSRTCRTPWQGRSRLVRQLSGSACVEGRSWQSQFGEVSVTAGCRGEFAAAARPIDGQYSVTCSSEDKRQTTCAWDARYGRPYLLQQLSGTACVQGRTWGQQRASAIWVSGGCRARFGPR